MSNLNYTLWVRSANMMHAAQIDQYVEFHSVQNFNDKGTWTLKIPADSNALDELVFGTGIRVMRNNTILFSGPLISTEWDWDTGNSYIIASGIDNTALLDSRLCLPTPSGPVSQTYPGTSNSGYDQLFSTATEDILDHYVNDNLGPGAQSQRQLTNFTIATSAHQGSTQDAQARFDNLLELCRGYASSGGSLGFRIADLYTNNPPSLQFQVYTPTDKSSTIIFDKSRQNLVSYKYTQTMASRNYYYAGDSHQLNARIFVEGSDNSSIAAYSRFEDFIDKSDTTDQTLMAQEITHQLEQHAYFTHLDCVVYDTPAVQFLRDYQLGDKITVILDDGTQVQQIVRSIKIDLNASSGEVLSPTLATPAAPPVLGAINQIHQRVLHVKRKTHRLERKY